MGQKITKEDLQDFALNFDNTVVRPLVNAGYERNKYNVFDILNIHRQELRHSDFLAFLMNPKRSGYIAQQFLQNFLSLLAQEYPQLNLDFFKIFFCNFEQVIVKREYKHIDLLLEIKLSNETYIVVIENKIDSGEQIYEDEEVKGQLAKYKKIVEAEYKNCVPIYLFLSPDKRQPSESGWTAIDYNLIYSVLCKVNIDTADSTIKTLVQDYKKMIRSQFKMEKDRALREAALQIYNANADIFDFIFESLPNRVEETAKIIHKYLSKLDWITIVSKRQNTYLDFRVNDITNIRNDLQIFFQIEVKDLRIWGYMQNGNEQDRLRLKVSPKSATVTLAKYEWLADNNKDVTKENIADFDRLLLENDLTGLEAKLNDLLDKIFGEDGYVRSHSERICKLLSQD